MAVHRLRALLGRLDEPGLREPGGHGARLRDRRDEQRHVGTQPRAVGSGLDEGEGPVVRTETGRAFCHLRKGGGETATQLTWSMGQHRDD